jgi:hypothetical protein
MILATLYKKKEDWDDGMCFEPMGCATSSAIYQSTLLIIYHVRIFSLSSVSSSPQKEGVKKEKSTPRP